MEKIDPKEVYSNTVNMAGWGCMLLMVVGLGFFIWLLVAIENTELDGPVPVETTVEAPVQ